MILRSVLQSPVPLLLLLASCCRFSHGLPMQVTINQRQSECLYENLNKGESVTVSVFILSGNMLKAAYTLDGPIAELGAESGLELYNGGREFTNDKGKRQLALSETVDFEHLMDEVDDDDDHIDDDDDDDDDDAVDDDVKTIEKDDPNAEKKRRERRERQRKKFLEAKKKREEKKLAQLKKIRQDGEPISITKKAPESGWYEFCVTAKWNQVSEQPQWNGIESIPVGVLLFRMFCGLFG